MTSLFPSYLGNFSSNSITNDYSSLVISITITFYVISVYIPVTYSLLLAILTLITALRMQNLFALVLANDACYATWITWTRGHRVDTCLHVAWRWTGCTRELNNHFERTFQLGRVIYFVQLGTFINYIRVYKSRYLLFIKVILVYFKSLKFF